MACVGWAVGSSFGGIGRDRGRADVAMRVVGIAALARAQRRPTPARAVRLAVVVFFLGTVLLFFVEDGDLMGQKTGTVWSNNNWGRGSDLLPRRVESVELLELIVGPLLVRELLQEEFN